MGSYFQQQGNLNVSEDFYGPFYNNNSTALFFFSLKNPVEYNEDKYEYEEEPKSIQEGHIFALFTIEKTEAKQVGIMQEQMRKTHTRVKRNMGSVLKSLDIEQLKNGQITLNYAKGDECGKGSYETSITLKCDKSVQSLTQVEYQSESSTSN